MIRSRPLPQLADDHPLTALAYIAASTRGLGTGHRRILMQPVMVRFAPTLTRLHRKAQVIHRRGGAAAPQQLQDLVDIALTDLAELCTPYQRRKFNTEVLSTIRTAYPADHTTAA